MQAVSSCLLSSLAFNAADKALVLLLGLLRVMVLVVSDVSSGRVGDAIADILLRLCARRKGQNGGLQVCFAIRWV